MSGTLQDTANSNAQEQTASASLSSQENLLKQAFVLALDPHGPVAEAFAHELRAAQPDFSEAATHESASDTLARRRAEQRIAATLDKPGKYPGGLPEGKIEELIEWLAQPRMGADSGSADALIHIHKNLRAQHDLHAALANRVFRAGGTFEEAVKSALLHAAPELSEPLTKNAAADFVTVRRERAQGVADALRPGGEVEQKAIALATRLRRQSDPSNIPVASRTNADRMQQQFGEDIAFGIQQTFACWGTDFIDPFVGKWFMDKYQDDHHHGTLTHTWGGEIIGDTAAFFAFLGVRQYFPQSLTALKHAARQLGDGFYERAGHKSLDSWAQKHHIAKDSEAYRQELENWKDFQADNFAKSSVISVSSVALNVATQKAMGNTHKVSVITTGKLIGAAITMASMLGLRFLIPQSTKELDRELSEKYFTPVVRRTQRLFGAPPDSEHDQKSFATDIVEPLKLMGRHTERLAQENPMPASASPALQ